MIGLMAVALVLSGTTLSATLTHNPTQLERDVGFDYQAAVDLSLEHANGFVQADGVADSVAAAARLAGFDVAPVEVPDIEDPIELMVEMATMAHELQVEATADMTEHQWDLAREGMATALAFTPAMVDASYPATDGPAIDADDERWTAINAGLDALDVERATLWQAAYTVAVGVDEVLYQLETGDPSLYIDGVERATPLGPVIVASAAMACTNDLYTAPFLLLIEPCGDDEYVAPAGGASTILGMPISVLVDLEGNDYAHSGACSIFVPTCKPAAGAASEAGIAVTVDVAGADTWGNCGDSMIAGAGVLAGLGVLVDLNGTDAYCTGGFLGGPKLGGGFFGGAGVLIDGRGSDSYSGDTYEEGSGWFLGAGVLADLGPGDDTYFDLSTFAQGSGGVLGVGLLVEEMGDESFSTASPYEQGAGGCGGLGILVNLAGDDTYNATIFGQGFGGSGASFGCTGEAGEIPPLALTSLGLPALGVLVDVSGHDSYTGDNLVQGSHDGRGVGILADLDGQDSYVALDCSQGFGGSVFGGVACPPYGSPPSSLDVWGAGVLVDLGSFGAGDFYDHAGCLGQGQGYSGALGALIDIGTFDIYLHGCSPVIDGGGFQPRGTSGFALEG